MNGSGVSVVIPVWNGRRYLEACLEALLAQEPPGFEVIGVDNASTDGSAEWIEQCCPQVRLLRNPDNLGFAGACNAGLRAAQGEVLVLLNQDTRVLPGWLGALLEALQRPQVGVVGCKALYPDGQTIQHAGGWVRWPLGIAGHDGAGERDAGQWNAPRALSFVTGAAMAFRRALLDEIGFLDEGFWPGYYEDVDFCFRAREAGYEVWYAPAAALIHYETGSLAGTSQLLSAYHRGRLRFVVKHLPPERFVREFAPAERAAHLEGAQGEAALALRMAYMRAVSAVATLYPARWGADASVTGAAIKALQELYLLPISEVESFDPALAEFEFRSQAPLVGGLIARLRALWYSVAARWAVRYLAGQQEAINRRLRAIQEQQEATNQLYIRSLAALSEEVARLAMRLGERQETGDEMSGGGSFTTEIGRARRKRGRRAGDGMSGGWIEIEDPGIDVQEVAGRVEERMSSRRTGTVPAEQEDPAGVARALWQERFGAPTVSGRLGEGVPADVSTAWIATWLRDCEIVPRDYAIDWRMPILGPIHALIRRIINAEIRRYLLAMLEKQSLLNRKVLETLDAFARENANLRQRWNREIERLRDEIDRGRGAG